MTTYHITSHITRMYTIELSNTVQMTLHISRYRVNEQKRVSCSITSATNPWNGRNDVNMGIALNWAIRQLRDWHTQGLEVEIFTIRTPDHTTEI